MSSQTVDHMFEAGRYRAVRVKNDKHNPVSVDSLVERWQITTSAGDPVRQVLLFTGHPTPRHIVVIVTVDELIVEELAGLDEIAVPFLLGCTVHAAVNLDVPSKAKGIAQAKELTRALMRWAMVDDGGIVRRILGLGGEYRRMWQAAADELAKTL